MKANEYLKKIVCEYKITAGLFFVFFILNLLFNYGFLDHGENKILSMIYAISLILFFIAIPLNLSEKRS